MIRVVAVLALFSVAACAAPRPPAGPTPGLDWFFVSDGGLGKLAYGAPDSDEILFQLECRAGAPDVRVSRPAAMGARPEIVVRAEGLDERRLAATPTASQTHDGVDLDTSVPIDDPLLAAFRQTGWLGVEVGGNLRRYVAQPPAAAIERFFAWCRP